MGIKVSVVVPVYNAERTLDNVVGSVLAQTLSRDELELICVDDGSTDDSLTRLRELAAEHPVLRVIAIPASGWPGKPRNVGTDAANGEYVMYLDADDRLEPESLQRMYDLGSANNADIVLGKVTSDFRFVHHYLYRENVASCTVGDSRIINSLTPHKMFRRDFLAEHHLRYPEGYHRLEDQLFVTRAYLAAQRCAIVADYVCYRYLAQQGGANIGRRFVAPSDYYDRVRVILDDVDALTEPGPLRDHVYRRFLRVELLGKMIGKRILYRPRDARELWLSHIKTLMQERFDPSIDAGLPTTMRLRAHLARTGSSDDLRALTERTRLVGPALTTAPAASPRSGTTGLEVSGELAFGDDGLLLDRHGDDWLLPESVLGSGLATGLRRVEPASEMMADIVLRDRSRHDEWFLTPPLAVTIEDTAAGGRIRLAGVVPIDPLTAAGGAPLSPGTYDVTVRVESFGLNRQRVLRQASCDSASVVSVEPRTMIKTDRLGRTQLAVGAKPGALRKRLAPLTFSLSSAGIKVQSSAGWTATPGLTGELVAGDGRRIKLWLVPADGDERTWTSSVGPNWRPGSYTLRVRFDRVGWLEADQPVRIPRDLEFLMVAVGRRVRRAVSAAQRLVG